MERCFIIIMATAACWVLGFSFFLLTRNDNDSQLLRVPENNDPQLLPSKAKTLLLQLKERRHPTSDTAMTSTAQLLVEVNLSQPSCGLHKCFFPSSVDQHIGWMVAEDVIIERNCTTTMTLATGAIPTTLPTTITRLESLNDGWKLAKELESKYGIRHFLLEPPVVLQRLSYGELIQLTEHTREEIHFTTERPIVVQKVRVAPLPNSELKCQKRSLPLYLKNFNKFMDPVENRTSFVQHFVDDMGDASQILEEYPTFGVDFQFLVDLNGFVHHIDFDRAYLECYTNDALREKVQECQPKLQKYLDKARKRARKNATGIP